MASHNRHTFATNLVLRGVDLVTVKELMGHVDISMTMRYAHPSPETKRKAVDVLLDPKKKWQMARTQKSLKLMVHPTRNCTNICGGVE